MASGAFNATTQANTNVADGVFSGPFTIVATNLVGGQNVVAVEVHQNGGASSDITFGAELNITVASVLYPTIVQSPQLIATRQPNGTVVLSWSGNGFTLEQATTLNPPSPVSWSTTPSQSNPYTVSPTNTAKFFRLRY